MFIMTMVVTGPNPQILRLHLQELRDAGLSWMSKCISYRPWVLKDFVPPWGNAQCLETFLVVTTGDCSWHLVVRVMDAAKHCVVPRTVPTTKKYLSPNVINTKVEKFCL
jgi:hypothetical protein